MAPRVIPITNEMKTATNPIAKDMRIPMSIRLNKSRPYLSVPRRNFFSEMYFCGISSTEEASGKSESAYSFCKPSVPSGVYSVISMVFFFKTYFETGISVSAFFFPKKKTDKGFCFSTAAGIVSICTENPGFLECMERCI